MHPEAVDARPKDDLVTTLAFVDVGPGDLRLDPGPWADGAVSGDEPGPVASVVLVTSVGPVTLIRHLGHPELGLEVRACNSGDPVTEIDAVLSATGIAPDRVTWLRPATPDDARRRWQGVGRPTLLRLRRAVTSGPTGGELLVR